MEENTKTEQIQNLDEEQLQAIAGGCGQCLMEARQANHHLTLATAYNKIATSALSRPIPKTEFARKMLDLSNGHKQAADNLLNTAYNRMNTPGHI